MKTYFDFSSETDPIIYERFTNVVGDTELNTLKNHFLNHNQVSEESKIYMRNEQKEMVDTKLRKSKKFHFSDKVSFDLVKESIIPKINNIVKDIHYDLVCDNIDIIIYEAGDFFEAHNDFVTIQSNTVKTYAFLLCLESDAVGGETIIHLTPKKSVIIKETITPGSAIVFRNEVLHEGSKVLSGHKIVMKLNILGIAKYSFKRIPAHLNNRDKFDIFLGTDAKQFTCTSEQQYRELYPLSLQYNVVPIQIMTACTDNNSNYKKPLVMIGAYDSILVSVSMKKITWGRFGNIASHLINKHNSNLSLQDNMFEMCKFPSANTYATNMNFINKFYEDDHFVRWTNLLVDLLKSWTEIIQQDEYGYTGGGLINLNNERYEEIDEENSKYNSKDNKYKSEHEIPNPYLNDKFNSIEFSNLITYITEHIPQTPTVHEDETYSYHCNEANYATMEGNLYYCFYKL